MARPGGTRELAVGAMAALALIILALAIMAVGGDSRLFGKKSYYRVVFPNADGLVVGSPVKISGVQVGTVSEIRLSPDPAAAGIEVRLGVDRAYAARVRADAGAALRILQLLSGEKFVEIIPGSEGAPQMPEDAQIRSQQDPEILQQAAVAAENINEITVSLKKILGTLERGEGLIGQMISDPDFAKEGLDGLRATIDNLQLLTSDLLAGRSGGQGFLGRLLYDEGFAAQLDHLGRAFEDIADVVAGLDLEQGAVGALLQPGGAGEQAILDLRTAAASVRRIGERLDAGEGLLGRLLNDPEYSEGLAADLRATMGNLAEVSGKINRGEGSLGALVNERTLHDGMEEVVAGVGDSKFARWLMRHYQKKGIKQQTKAEAAADSGKKP